MTEERPKLTLEILPPPEIKPETRQQRTRRQRQARDGGDSAEAGNPVIPEDQPPGEEEPILDAVFGSGYEPPAEDNRPLIDAPDKPGPDAKDKPPTIDEWQNFIGRVVLKLLTQGYLALMLGDIEQDLTPHEREMIRLSKEDLLEMAAPFASFANKNKTMKKHGRQIIAATESYEALIVMFLWMRRVQRIANRHKRARAQQQFHEENQQGPGIMGMIVPDGVIPEAEVNGHGNANGTVSGPGTGLGYPSHPISRPGFGG